MDTTHALAEAERLINDYADMLGRFGFPRNAASVAEHGERIIAMLRQAIDTQSLVMSRDESCTHYIIMSQERCHPSPSVTCQPYLGEGAE